MNRHLGIPVERIREITQSKQRFEDAKTSGETFSVQKRSETYQKLEQFYGTELEQVFKWMLRNNPAVQIRPNISGSLNI